MIYMVFSPYLTLCVDVSYLFWAPNPEIIAKICNVCIKFYLFIFSSWSSDIFDIKKITFVSNNFVWTFLSLFLLYCQFFEKTNFAHFYKVVALARNTESISRYLTQDAYNISIKCNNHNRRISSWICDFLTIEKEMTRQCSESNVVKNKHIWGIS